MELNYDDKRFLKVSICRLVYVETTIEDDGVP